jgi:hypothetical protein
MSLVKVVVLIEDVVAALVSCLIETGSKIISIMKWSACGDSRRRGLHPTRLEMMWRVLQSRRTKPTKPTPPPFIVMKGASDEKQNITIGVNDDVNTPPTSGGSGSRKEQSSSAPPL